MNNKDLNQIQSELEHLNSLRKKIREKILKREIEREKEVEYLTAKLKEIELRHIKIQKNKLKIHHNFEEHDLEDHTSFIPNNTKKEINKCHNTVESNKSTCLQVQQKIRKDRVKNWSDDEHTSLPYKKIKKNKVIYLSDDGQPSCSYTEVKKYKKRDNIHLISISTDDSYSDNLIPLIKKLSDDDLTSTSLQKKIRKNKLINLSDDDQPSCSYTQTKEHKNLIHNISTDDLYSETHNLIPFTHLSPKELNAFKASLDPQSSSQQKESTDNFDVVDGGVLSKLATCFGTTPPINPPIHKVDPITKTISDPCWRQYFREYLPLCTDEQINVSIKLIHLKLNGHDTSHDWRLWYDSLLPRLFETVLFWTEEADPLVPDPNSTRTRFCAGCGLDIRCNSKRSNPVSYHRCQFYKVPAVRPGVVWYHPVTHWIFGLVARLQSDLVPGHTSGIRYQTGDEELLTLEDLANSQLLMAIDLMDAGVFTKTFFRLKRCTNEDLKRRIRASLDSIRFTSGLNPNIMPRINMLSVAARAARDKVEYQTGKELWEVEETTFGDVLESIPETLIEGMKGMFESARSALLGPSIMETLTQSLKQWVRGMDCGKILKTVLLIIIGILAYVYLPPLVAVGLIVAIGYAVTCKPKLINKLCKRFKTLWDNWDLVSQAYSGAVYMYNVANPVIRYQSGQVDYKHEVGSCFETMAHLTTNVQPKLNGFARNMGNVCTLFKAGDSITKFCFAMCRGFTKAMSIFLYGPDGDRDTWIRNQEKMVADYFADVKYAFTACEAQNGRTILDVEILEGKFERLIRLLQSTRLVRERLARLKRGADVIAIMNYVRDTEMVLNKKYETHINRQYTQEQRVEPVVIYVHGDPGCGKSSGRNVLLEQVYKNLGEEFVPTRDVYTKPGSSDYWEAYIHQKVFFEDDIFAIKSPEMLERQFDAYLHMANGEAYNLNMASLDTKGITQFTSEVIYLTSNKAPENLPVATHMYDPEAFHRRLDIIARASRASGSTVGVFQPETMTYTTKTRIFNEVTQRMEYVNKDINMATLAKVISTKLQNNRDKRMRVLRGINMELETVEADVELLCGKVHYQTGEAELLLDSAWGEDVLRPEEIPMTVINEKPEPEDPTKGVFSNPVARSGFERSLRLGMWTFTFIGIIDMGVKVINAIFLWLMYHLLWITGITKLSKVVGAKITAWFPDTTAVAIKIARVFANCILSPFSSFCGDIINWIGAIILLHIVFVVGYMALKLLFHAIKYLCRKIFKSTDPVYYQTWDNKDKNKSKGKKQQLMKNRVRIGEEEVAMKARQDKIDFYTARYNAGELDHEFDNIGIENLEMFMADKLDVEPYDRCCFQCKMCGFRASHAVEGCREDHNHFVCKSCDKRKKYTGGNFLGNDPAAQSTCNLIEKNSVMVVMVSPNKPARRRQRGLFICDTWLLTNKHFLDTYKKYVSEDSGTYCCVMYCNKDGEYEEKICGPWVVSMTHDVAICRVNALPMYRDIVHCFFKTMPVVTGRQVTRVTKVDGTETYTYHTGRATPQTACTIMHTVEGVDVETRADRVIVTDSPGSTGECGAPVVVFDSRLPGASRICGIHMAGNPDPSAALSVTEIVLQEDLLQLMQLAGDYIERRAFSQSGQNLTTRLETDNYITLPKELSVRISADTKLMKADFKFSRLPWEYSQTVPPLNRKAFYQGVNKNFCDTSYTVHPSIEDMVIDALVFRYNNMKSSVSGTRKVLTVMEAVNGIIENGVRKEHFPRMNPHTSAGYLIRDTSVGKNNVFVFDGLECTINPRFIELVEQRIVCAKKGVIEPTVFIEQMKDERRSIEDGVTNNIRIFAYGPVDLHVVTRMYFGAFILHLAENHMIGNTAVGLNLDNVESSTAWFSFLEKTGDHWMGGDYKKYDKRIPYEVTMAFIKIVNEWYADGQVNARVRTVIGSTIFRSLRLAGSDLYQADHGMPSGTVLTSVGNSVCNSFMIRCCYVVCMLSSKRPELAYCYDGVVGERMYGDDHILRVKSLVIGEFNMITLAKNLKILFRMDYTMPDKKSKLQATLRGEELTFLKRSFQKRDGMVWACLDMETLEQIPLWTARSAPVDAYSNTVHSFMLYLSRYSEQVYEEKISHLFSCFHDYTDYPPISYNKACAVMDHAVFDPSGLEVKLDEAYLVDPIIVRYQGEDETFMDAPTTDTVSYPVTKLEETEKAQVVPLDPRTDLKLGDELAFGRAGSQENFLTRTYLAYKQEWVVGDHGRIMNIFFPQFLTRLAPVANKLRYYKYLRCGLKFHVVVNGTPYHYGLAFLRWIPAVTDTTMTCATYAYTDHYSCSGMSASNQPGVDIIPTGSRSYTFEVPYELAVQQLDLERLATQSTHNDESLGSLNLHIINPLINLSSGPDITISIFAAMTDPVLSTPTPVSFPFESMVEQPTLKLKDYLLPSIPSNKVVYQTGKSEAVEKSRQGVLSKSLGIISATAALLTTVPSLFVPAAIVSGVSGVAGVVASYFGYSKPVDCMTDRPIMFRTADVATTRGLWTANKVTFDPENEKLSLGPAQSHKDEEYLFSEIVSRFTYIGTVTVDNTVLSGDTVVTVGMKAYLEIVERYASPLGASVVVKGLPFMSMVSKVFQYWRGDFRVRFEFVCSQFHSQRYRIFYVPGAARTTVSFDDQNIALSNIVTVNGYHEEIIEIGYNSVLYAMPVGEAMGYLYVAPLAPLTSAIASAGPMYINTYIALSPNSEFFVPFSGTTAPYIRTDVSRVVRYNTQFQTGEEERFRNDFVALNSTRQVQANLTGEVLCSVKDVMQRAAALRAQDKLADKHIRITPASNYMIDSQAMFYKDHDQWPTMPWWLHFSYMYRFHSGGFIFSWPSTTANVYTYLDWRESREATISETSITKPHEAYQASAGGVAIPATTTQNSKSVRIPYYSTRPYAYNNVGEPAKAVGQHEPSFLIQTVGDYASAPFVAVADDFHLSRLFCSPTLFMTSATVMSNNKGADLRESFERLDEQDDLHPPLYADAFGKARIVNPE